VGAVPDVTAVDPFDLPEWLGEGEVTWTAGSGVAGSSHVVGDLAGAGEPLPCDLLAADVAYPEPVLEEGWRRAAHQQWRHGEVLLASYDRRLTLVVPGTELTADRALECLARLARAVGARPDRFVVALRL
jgi:hypothetical protein